MTKKNVVIVIPFLIIILAVGFIIPKYFIKGIKVDEHISGPALSLAAETESPNPYLALAITKIENNDVYVGVYTLFGIKINTILIKNLKVSGPEKDYGYTYDYIGSVP